MPWTRLASSSVDCNASKFTEAIEIWLRRPNVCSRIISCAQVTELQRPQGEDAVCKILDKIGHAHMVINANDSSQPRREDCTPSNPTKFYFRRLIPKKPDIHCGCCELVVIDNTVAIFVPISENYSANLTRSCYKIGISTENPKDTCQTYKEFKKDLIDHVLSLEVLIGDRYLDDLEESGVLRPCCPTKQWVKDKLFSSILKWCKDISVGSNLSKDAKKKVSLPASLSLIPQHEYAEKYHYLKEKYGKELIKVWTEVTDPKKYIYEDIAIATYLMLLWKKERETLKNSRFQSFVDLGCGNGLLVHILNSEGHPGKGVDIRRRKIWDIYPSSTNLVEEVVDPTNGVLYSEYDWLLGNHSDELTPWIPVLAARSGYDVRYWVLPCCFFDFFVKYKRSQSVMGQYDDYLGFVKNVGEVCGFDVGVDVMRIPSTKRVCHVGMQKLYPIDDHWKVVEEIEKFVGNRRILQNDFQAREKVEKVKNCTKMDKDIQNKVVKVIVEKLLEEGNFISVRQSGHLRQSHVDGKSILGGEFVLENGDDIQGIKDTSKAQSVSLKKEEECPIDDRPKLSDSEAFPLLTLTNEQGGNSVQPVVKSSQLHREIPDGLSKMHCTAKTTEETEDSAQYFTVRKTWNRGGHLKLDKASHLLSDDLKSHLKSECGGLQTLLRNHHQVFEVLNGEVRLRDWSNLDHHSKRRKKKIRQSSHLAPGEHKKTRQCWFFQNHPDGCPRTDDQCPFLHV